MEGKQPPPPRRTAPPRPKDSPTPTLPKREGGGIVGRRKQGTSNKYFISLSEVPDPEVLRPKADLRQHPKLEFPLFPLFHWDNKTNPTSWHVLSPAEIAEIAERASPWGMKISFIISAGQFYSRAAGVCFPRGGVHPYHALNGKNHGLRD